VDFGISYFATDEMIAPAALAPVLEERGFESLFVTEHTHIPASRDTPYPIGEPLPREYWRIYDPFIALATAAQVTETLKIGTAICLVVERDPIITAKEVATLDHLSGGRFLFGVGAGWLLEEMRNHGTDPKRRFGILRERVEAMKEIWANDEAEYHGKYVDFDPIVQFPKPIQRPHPPILVGGQGETVFDRVLGYGNEWFPNRMGDDDFIIGRIQALQDAAKAAGRGPVPVSLQIPPRDPARLERYAEAGVTRAVYMLRAGEHAEVQRKLDQFTEAKNAYLGGT
jgi:probable F420-dependent oxidoreductase